MEKVNVNGATTISDAEVSDIFDYHPWSEEKIEAGKRVRTARGHAFKVIIENVPPGPDRTVALRKLREARMDANSGLTHGGRY